MHRSGLCYLTNFGIRASARSRKEEAEGRQLCFLLLSDLDNKTEPRVKQKNTQREGQNGPTTNTKRWILWHSPNGGFYFANKKKHYRYKSAAPDYSGNDITVRTDEKAAQPQRYDETRNIDEKIRDIPVV